MLLQTMPALGALALQLWRIERVAGRAQWQPGLEHDGHRVLDVVRLGRVGVAGLLERLRVRAVPGKAVGQA